MLSLRRAAKEDSMLLFEWINDSDVRKNSFNPNYISIEEHLKWFESKLHDVNCEIYIILYNYKNIGMLRLEKEGSYYKISYLIDKKYRGKGIGTKLLSYIKKIFFNRILVGYVKYDNTASIKAFEKSKYIKINKENYIKFISKYESNIKYE